MKKTDIRLAKEVQKWFLESVTFNDEPYTIDLEQAMAVADTSKNTIVAARAGSGKTRTIVAKIVYLVAKCGIKPNEIMTFVFNSNAAKEINMRLGQMKVNGEIVIENAKIASTFHAFSRKVVYDWCGGKEKCKEILAEDKEEFLYQVVKQLMMDSKWRRKIKSFLSGGEANEVTEGLWQQPDYVETELRRLAKMMTQFVNRAQQKYLGSGVSLNSNVEQYLLNSEIEERERLFIEIGTECYDRYHQNLLCKKKSVPTVFSKYGTDFNLIVSWAAKLIKNRRGLTKDRLRNKKYLLIDEYQDFSQLFLYAVFAIRSVAKDANLFVVGDDLQAINRFAGSEVEYFKNFEQFFGGDSSRLTISTNYRCGYEIVDMAHKFMKKAMKEKGSFKAFSHKAGEVVVVNLSNIDVGYAMVDYDKRVSNEDKTYGQIARKMLGHSPKIMTLKYLKVLIEIIRQNNGAEDILVLHRNNEMNEEGIGLVELKSGLREAMRGFGVVEDDEFERKVKVMTMHKSKGLEAEVVIILEADEGVIPKEHPDTELFSVFGETTEIALADQKRLFYVAMTRAKKKLYIIYNGLTRKSFLKYLGRGIKQWEE
ncbi:ATP-dependent helicase [Candidatus Saccharibacteria bacterium]|nr:ATP-dependent helicase [Candidatus Saccharibacteria bacterium]